MGKTAAAPFPPPGRWWLWLLAGIVIAVVLGFALGLAKPRVKPIPKRSAKANPGPHEPSPHEPDPYKDVRP